MLSSDTASDMIDMHYWPICMVSVVVVLVFLVGKYYIFYISINV